MKFKNFEVEPLARLLFNLSLKNKDSRMRTQFVNLLDAHLRGVIGEGKRILVEQFAKRDENGEFVMNTENPDLIDLNEETTQEYHLEDDILMNEYFHVEESEANKLMILSIAETLLDGDFTVSGEDAVLYDKWCEQFEKVSVDYGVEA